MDGNDEGWSVFVFPPFGLVRGDYRGEDFIVDFGAAMAFSGDLMIELMKPRGPSVFQEFADNKRTSVQHLAAYAADMAAAQTEIEARGGKRIQGMAIANGSEIAYFAMTPDKSVILEIVMIKPEVHALFDAIKQDGATWDGKTKTFVL